MLVNLILVSLEKHLMLAEHNIFVTYESRNMCWLKNKYLNSKMTKILSDRCCAPCMCSERIAQNLSSFRVIYVFLSQHKFVSFICDKNVASYRNTSVFKVFEWKHLLLHLSYRDVIRFILKFKQQATNITFN